MNYYGMYAVKYFSLDSFEVLLVFAVIFGLALYWVIENYKDITLQGLFVKDISKWAQVDLF